MENKQAIVVFSDVEYLLSINDFISIMNMFRDYVDDVRMADHLLMSALYYGSYDRYTKAYF